MTKKAALLLLPNLLGEQQHHQIFLPASVDKAVESLDGLIAESETEGRRYLKRFRPIEDVRLIPIALLNSNTREDEIDFLLEPIKDGQRWGVVSDAGLPCIADPGYLLVRRARELGIAIQAFVGPSAITLSLMLSGLPAQKFSFEGYIDRDPEIKKKAIKNFEEHSRKNNSTILFIEAPYRNRHTLDALLEVLRDETKLCAAWDLTLPTQGILSQSVAIWKKSPLPNLDKKPAIFLISY